MRKKIVSFVIVLILLLTSICVPIYAATESELNDQKSELKDKIDDAKNAQDEVKEQLSAQMEEISKLDESIAVQEAEISELELQIFNLNNSIEEKQKELEKKQKEYEENKELLEERLVAMYETGQTNFLDILFSSSNIIEFISNYYMVAQVTNCDKELLDSIEKEQKEIETVKQTLEDEKAEVDSAKKQKETKANLLKAKKQERQTKADALSAEDKALQKQIDDYNDQVAKIEQQIKEIIQKNNSSNGNGLKFDGSFIWPCNNKVVTSRVKWRWGRWHKGIDIGANHENVYAAASGYAYNLENPGGYGHYIMIIHGDGYITLYGHLLARHISSGQYVSQGQVMATSGGGINDEGRGNNTGRHLHFEIRKATSLSGFFSSSFLDPLDYLPGGYTIAD